MQVQRTWNGIMNAPVRLDDVVLAEMLALPLHAQALSHLKAAASPLVAEEKNQSASRKRSVDNSWVTPR
jgi:hypothetical protein